MTARLVPLFVATVALLGLTVWSAALPAAGWGNEQVASDTLDRTVLPPQDKSLRAPNGAPNVLLVMGDDVGFGQPGTFGGPVETPTLDRLAKEGLRYNYFQWIRPASRGNKNGVTSG